MTSKSPSKEELLEYTKQLEDLLYFNVADEITSTRAILPGLLDNNRSVLFKTQAIKDVKTAISMAPNKKELLERLSKYREIVSANEEEIYPL